MGEGIMTPPKRKGGHPAAGIKVPPPPPDWRGSAVTTAKVDENDVRRIRAMHAAGWSILRLSKLYKMTWTSMSRIIKRESWKHVE